MLNSKEIKNGKEVIKTPEEVKDKDLETVKAEIKSEGEAKSEEVINNINEAADVALESFSDNPELKGDVSKIVSGANNEISSLTEDFENTIENGGFPEDHIMNPGAMDKIAQLEAISTDTLEFSQARYDEYINSSEGNTIKESQKEIQKRLDEGKKPRYYNASIYGKGGWNRYNVDDDGGIRLASGSTVTTGTPEYRAKLAQKAKELGIRFDQ